MRLILPALAAACCMALGACGGDEKGGNTVQMKDLEVVDGTATDAMTDLDGVQSEVPAAMPGAGEGNAAVPEAKEEPAGNGAQGDTEVLSDQ